MSLESFLRDPWSTITTPTLSSWSLLDGLHAGELGACREEAAAAGKADIGTRPSCGLKLERWGLYTFKLSEVILSTLLAGTEGLGKVYGCTPHEEQEPREELYENTMFKRILFSFALNLQNVNLM